MMNSQNGCKFVFKKICTEVNVWLFKLFNVSLSRVFRSILFRFVITRLDFVWHSYKVEDLVMMSRIHARHSFKIVIIPAEGFYRINRWGYFKKLLQKNLFNMIWFFFCVLKLYISNIYFYPLLKMIHKGKETKSLDNKTHIFFSYKYGIRIRDM